jgi:hypothetical protein
MHMVGRAFTRRAGSVRARREYPRCGRRAAAARRASHDRREDELVSRRSRRDGCGKHKWAACTSGGSIRQSQSRARPSSRGAQGSYALTHAHPHARSHARSLSCARTHSHSLARSHVRTHSRTHAQKQSTHARTHTHIRQPPGQPCLGEGLVCTWFELSTLQPAADSARRRSPRAAGRGNTGQPPYRPAAQQ